MHISLTIILNPIISSLNKIYCTSRWMRETNRLDWRKNMTKNMSCTTSKYALTVKSTKYFWLFSPTQLLTQGQWWSIFLIHRWPKQRVMFLYILIQNFLSSFLACNYRKPFLNLMDVGNALKTNQSHPMRGIYSGVCGITA